MQRRIGHRRSCFLHEFARHLQESCSENQQFCTPAGATRPFPSPRWTLLSGESLRVKRSSIAARAVSSILGAARLRIAPPKLPHSTVTPAPAGVQLLTAEPVERKRDSCLRRNDGWRRRCSAQGVAAIIKLSPDSSAQWGEGRVRGLSTNATAGGSPYHRHSFSPSAVRSIAP